MHHELNVKCFVRKHGVYAFPANRLSVGKDKVSLK